MMMRKMIICNIKGGVGNQLFQYAVGRAIAIRHNVTCKFDTADIVKNAALSSVPRHVRLTLFNTIYQQATPEEVVRLRFPYGRISRIWHYFQARLAPADILNFEPSVLEISDNYYLDGYFQSYKYFEGIRPQLLGELTIKVKTESHIHWENAIRAAANSVAVHVRRGDYINNPSVTREFGICSADYYTAAVAKIAAEQANPTFFVFSDDIAWVKENISFASHNTHYVSDEHLSDVDDLALMSYCQHNIIANSSFSWWSAWLNQNESKTVIAPTPWFDNGIMKEADLLPPDWVQIAK